MKLIRVGAAALNQTPLEWDGDLTRELFDHSSRKLGDFDGKTVKIAPNNQPPIPSGGHLSMVADLYGDFRDELVVVRREDQTGFRGLGRGQSRGREQGDQGEQCAQAW